MSWAEFLDTGRGVLSYRASVEGLGYEFVSSSAMETTTSEGRERLGCLSVEGIGWTETAEITDGKLSVDGFSLRLVDRQRDAALTKALAWQPSTRTWLDADVTVGATSITVLSTAALTAGDVIHLGTEAMKITTVTSATVLAVTRAYWGTIAQAHYTADGARLLRPVVTLDRPMSIEGRRCNLYAYGAGDDQAGSGTLVFRGVCATDAALDSDGASWSIVVDSITRLLDAPMGGELEEPTGSRGIHYSWATPLTITVSEWSTPPRSFVFQIPSADHTTAFFETQGAFVAYLSDAIDTEASSFAAWDVTSIIAVEGSNDWWISVQMGATATDVTVRAASGIDGVIDLWHDPGGDPIAAPVANGLYDVRFSGLARYSGEIEGSVLRAVPRAQHGQETGIDAPGIADMSDPFGPTKIYLGGTIDVSGLTAVRVDAPNGDSGYMQVTNVDSAERWILLGAVIDGDGLGTFGYGFGSDVELRFVRHLGDGDISVIRDALVADSPRLANVGGLPFLTDTELASWTSVAADAGRGRQWAAERRYIVDEETSAADYLAEEAKAIGVFPITDADGKIAIRRMESPAGTDPSTVDLGVLSIAVDGGFPSWERNAFGRYNQVIYSWGYDPSEEEHRGTIVIRDVQAFSESKVGNSIEAAPKSEPINGPPTPGELVSMAWPYLGVFGRAYAVVRFDAPLPVYFDALLGDSVSVTVPGVPDQLTGERGITSVAGIVVERGADLQGGRATIGVLVLAQEIAGYAPAMRIVSYTVDGGGEYTLTLKRDNPQASALDMTHSSDALTDHWGVNDAVMLHDSATTTAPIVGVVNAIPTTTTITVALSAAPVGLDIIRYDTSDRVRESQRAYVFQAADDGTLTYSAGVGDAQRYAP